MNTEKFEMVAKTFQGLEEILADELRNLGAENISPGRRMVSFEGDTEMLYKANLCCRTALRILKPIFKFTAEDADTLYDMTKEFDWESILSVDSTFSIDPVVNSDIFTHSRYVTYRVKDAIVDHFKDKYGADKRPGVRLQDADVMLNVHIDENRVTFSLDSSGESLHRRGYRVAQTEAPINEVLAAGIILKSGWDGSTPLVDPMCGSGTFLIEAALIAANINPGVYRKKFAFENWNDFDEELFESLYNDDSNERSFAGTIYGSDISPKAIAISEKNIKQAGVGKYIDLSIKPLSQWEEAPEEGTLITNPPYGERITVEDMEGLYSMIGTKLKKVFKGYKAWIIGYQEEYFKKIGLTPSVKMPILNGALECELREYEIFEGDYKSFRREGNSLDKHLGEESRGKKSRRLTDTEWRIEARKKGFGGKDGNKKMRRERDDDEFSRDKKGGKDRKFKDDRRGDRKFRSDRDSYKDSDRRGKGKDSFRRDDDRKFKDDHRFKEERRFKDDRKPRRDYDSDRNYPKRHDDFDTNEPSENPLAARRNVKALDSIIGKQPSIPAMGHRKGWKKPDND